MTAKKIGEIIPEISKNNDVEVSNGYKFNENDFNELWKLFKGKYEVSDANKDVLSLIKNYFLGVKNFDPKGLVSNESSLDKGLLIHGDYGIGKSFLFDILHQMGTELMKKRNDSSLWFKSISANAFVNLYMDQVTRKQKDSTVTFDIKNYYKGKLYIDDLGFEQLAFNRLELFSDILFERNRFNQKTFVTTNLIPSKIGDKYGERIGDRLPEMFNIVKWSGESYRK